MSFLKRDRAKLNHIVEQTDKLESHLCMPPDPESIKGKRKSIVMHITSTACGEMKRDSYGRGWIYLDQQLERMARFLPVEEIESWHREIAEEKIESWKAQRGKP